MAKSSVVCCCCAPAERSGVVVGVGRLLAAMARRSARRGSWRVGSAAMVVERGIGNWLLFGVWLQQLWRAERSWMFSRGWVLRSSEVKIERTARDSPLKAKYTSYYIFVQDSSKSQEPLTSYIPVL